MRCDAAPPRGPAIPHCAAPHVARGMHFAFQALDRAFLCSRGRGRAPQVGPEHVPIVQGGGESDVGQTTEGRPVAFPISTEKRKPTVTNSMGIGDPRRPLKRARPCHHVPIGWLVRSLESMPSTEGSARTDAGSITCENTPARTKWTYRQVDGGSKPPQLSLLYDRTNFAMLLDDEMNRRNTREARLTSPKAAAPQPASYAQQGCALQHCNTQPDLCGRRSKRCSTPSWTQGERWFVDSSSVARLVAESLSARFCV